jgi:hypothetical protein
MPINKYNLVDAINASQSGFSLAEEIMQSGIAQTPGAFDYAQLDKKYPTLQVRPILPTYIQQDMDEKRIAQKEALATQRIREAQASIYESQLNEQIAQAEQVPLAREYFSKLNPQSADWPEQRDTAFAQFPLIEGSAFAKSRIASMDRLYDNWAKKNLSPDAAKEKYKKAMNEKLKIQELRGGTVTDPSELEYISMLDQEINDSKLKMGLQPTAPQQGAAIPSAKEGKIYRQNGKNYKYTNGQFVEMP